MEIRALGSESCAHRIEEQEESSWGTPWLKGAATYAEVSGAAVFRPRGWEKGELVRPSLEVNTAKA